MSSAVRSRACLHCARAKARCIWQDDQTCQRCVKNAIDCTMPEPAPRKRRGKGKSTRVMALEEKVDGIMSLLSAAHGLSSTASTDSPRPLLQQPNSLPSPVDSIRTPSTVAESHSRQAPSVEHASSQLSPSIDVSPGLRITLAEADQILSEYRTDFVHRFPFVPLPIGSARDLHHERPFLLKTIISSCRPRTFAIKSEFDRWFRETVAHRIVVLNESNIELLQAILVYLAWREFHIYAHARDSGLLHLAMSIAGNMGLYKAPHVQKGLQRSIADSTTMRIRGFNSPTLHTSADQRALLGLFYISSVVWTQFHRTPPLEYTSYVGQCCNDLAQFQEFNTDLLLVGLIRIQGLVVQNYKAAMERVETQDKSMMMVSHAMTTATVTKQLDEIVKQIPQNLLSNNLIWIHYNNTICRMHEEIIDAASPQATEPSGTRTQFLWACLQNAKATLEVYLQIPPSDWSSFSFAHMSIISFTNVTLSRLVFHESPDWDAATAREAVNYPDIMQRLSDHAAEAHRQCGTRAKMSESGRGLLLEYSEKLLWAKSWYQSKLPVDDPSVMNNVMVDPLSSFPMEGDDSQFWSMLFNPYMT
ncbi:hypothetical protein BX600DRAFT_553624 [Xylariales sp. PMI_506]|nr:hypothetical protein BX600DRAFT_553624 [Xylariales sp. PMI_506]